MTRKKVTIEIDGPPDKQGKTPFTAVWVCPSTGRNRAQCFRADLEEQKNGWAANGFKIEIKNVIT